MEDAGITKKTKEYLDTIKNSLPEWFRENMIVILAVTALFIIIIFGCLYINYILSGKLTRQCSLVNSIYNDININIKPIISNDYYLNKSSTQAYALSTLPIVNFYIKTSYNSCSVGGYINDNVDTCILTKIISQGVRCFDFEIFNVNNYAVVSTSMSENPWMKETYNYIQFTDVLNTLIQGAMVDGCNNTTDPLFINLRMKTKNVEVYNDIASTLSHYTNQYLLQDKYNCENVDNFYGTVTLGELISKIVIIVETLENSTILESSNLYYYTNIIVNKNQYFRYESFTNTVNDNKDDIIKETMLKTLFLTPDVYNGEPSNPEPASCFARGVQFIGMSYQIFDTYLQAYEYFFNTNGNAFVLKNPDLMATVWTQTIPELTPEAPKTSISIDLGNGSFANFGGNEVGNGGAKP